MVITMGRVIKGPIPTMSVILIADACHRPSLLSSKAMYSRVMKIKDE
jgi:hypothetical protein